MHAIVPVIELLSSYEHSGEFLLLNHSKCNIVMMTSCGYTIRALKKIIIYLKYDIVGMFYALALAISILPQHA